MANLWNDIMPFEDRDIDFVPYIEEYPANSPGAVIIFAGGAYHHRTAHEDEGIAKWLQKNGVTAFVVGYRISPYSHPAPLSDAMRAVRYVRHYAHKYGIDRNKIAVLGSSAGGHLAGSVSVHYDKGIYPVTDDIDLEDARPDATVMCYPVIDMGEYRHNWTRENLLGVDAHEDMIDFMSLYKQIDKNTPEAFIWHTATDEAVPAMNSLLYAQGLSREKIPYELHIYPMGPHGAGLATAPSSIELPYIARWSDNLLKWLEYKEWK